MDKFKSSMYGLKPVFYAKFIFLICFITVFVSIIHMAVKVVPRCFDLWPGSEQATNSSRARVREPVLIGPHYFVDAALPCKNETIRRWLTDRLMELSKNCPTEIYLEVQKNGEFYKTADTRRVPGNAMCPRKPVISPFKNLSSTGLVSWPGSGNTWTRHLLQQLTGIQTGSVYTDSQLKNGGFPGEGLTTNVIATKTHFVSLDRTDVLMFDKQIILLRNPFDAFLAEYRRRNGDHTATIRIKKDDPGWNRYVAQATRKWPYFVKSLLVSDSRLLFVMYEDLQSCLMRELLRLASFLQTSQLTTFSICCAMSNLEGRFHRNHTDPPIASFYSAEVQTSINLMLSRLSKDVAQGFPVLSKWLLDYRR